MLQNRNMESISHPEGKSNNANQDDSGADQNDSWSGAQIKSVQEKKKKKKSVQDT